MVVETLVEVVEDDGISEQNWEDRIGKAWWALWKRLEQKELNMGFD